MKRQPGILLLSGLLSLLVACAGDRDQSPEPRPTEGPSAPANVATAGRTLAGPPQLAPRVVASGFERPTFVTHAGDGTGRLFVAEKRGRIRVVLNGQVQPTPFLDISALVESSANERGLLGLAFHPEFRANGRFFVTYTARDDRVVLVEYRATPGAAAANPTSARILFGIAHPRTNHNGGMVAFGPDGFLYMGTGDGGGGGDPDRAGQDLLSFAGKILRFDVDAAGDGYRIPETNPFVVRSSARGEIWAYGFRNPWRFSFDRRTGDLWIGDVGQDTVEEIDFQPASSKGGENYGWSVREGDRCFRPASGCSSAGLTDPVYTYTHGDGCSVTGGYVYRGTLIADLDGFYLLTDYCDSTLIALRRAADGSVTATTVGKAPGSPTSFGEDERGELYVLSDKGTLSVLEAAR